MKRTIFGFALLIVLLLSLSAPAFAIPLTPPPEPEPSRSVLSLTRGAKLSKAIQDAKQRNKLTYEIPLWVKFEEVNNHGSLSPFFNEVR